VKGAQIPTEDNSIPAGERQRWSAIAQRDRRYGFCVFGATEAECAKELEEFAPCPYGRRGERLWVRETWYCNHFEVHKGPYLQPAGMVDLDLDQAREDSDLVYAADGLTQYEQEQPTWKPSIHTPHWVSRILLGITDVRVERLQDISEEQALAEGVGPPLTMRSLASGITSKASKPTALSRACRSNCSGLPSTAATHGTPTHGSGSSSLRR
jgi:hypothetical protein